MKEVLDNSSQNFLFEKWRLVPRIMAAPFVGWLTNFYLFNTLNVNLNIKFHWVCDGIFLKSQHSLQVILVGILSDNIKGYWHLLLDDDSTGRIGCNRWLSFLIFIYMDIDLITVLSFVIIASLFVGILHCSSGSFHNWVKHFFSFCLFHGMLLFEVCYYFCLAGLVIPRIPRKRKN